MEYAALIDGCPRWGGIFRVALPSALPAIAVFAVFSLLFPCDEFRSPLVLTGQRSPIFIFLMAQFVHEMGIEWHLMSATAILALAPAFMLTLFGQKYVIQGLRL